MTTEVGIFEAKTRLSELVDHVATNGDEVVITKRGRPVARLMPTAAKASPVEDALALLMAAREASVAGSDSLRDLIDDGRAR